MWKIIGGRRSGLEESELIRVKSVYLSLNQNTQQKQARITTMSGD